MILASVARSRIVELGLSRTRESERVSLAELSGRVLAEDLYSAEAVPAWDNSAMDGFAVDTIRAASRNALRFRVLDSVSAGDTGQIAALVPALQSDALPTAVEIMTGAPVPAGPWDSVVKVEEVEVFRDSHGRPVEILLRALPSAGDNIRRKGEDFAIGQQVATQGMVITPDLVLALATLGISSAQVSRRPRVAVLSTGRELVSPEVESLAPGMIRNSTASYLLSALPRLGCEVEWLGTIADDPADFKKKVIELLKSAPDVLLTTGAVSMGNHDFVREALEELGATVHFHKLAIRPGKPLLFAEFKSGPVVFGVPGNPISTAVGLRFFVQPFLRAMLGLPPEMPIRARLKSAAKKPDGLRCYFKARLELSENGVWVESLPGQGSALVGPLLKANAWVELPESGGRVEAGTWVDVHPLFPLEKDWVFEVASVSSAELRGSAPAYAKLPIPEHSSEKGCCHS